MRFRMYSMEALNAFVTRMTTALETSYTPFNVAPPSIHFTNDSAIVEYKISNVDGLESISFDIDNGDFSIWVIFTNAKGKTTIKSSSDFEEKITAVNNTMMKLQLECIKRAVENSIERE